MEGQDISLCMKYIQIAGQILAENNIENEEVKKVAAELAVKSLSVLKESLVRAGANAAGIITN